MSAASSLTNLPILDAIASTLTFDDVLLTPNYADFLPSEANTSSRLSTGITLNTPFLSAAMDSVTTAPMAIALAHEGGLGIIHKNLSVKKQAAEVAQVKKFESGIIADPITIDVKLSAYQALELANKHNISGFPVLDDAQNLVGIVTRRDLRYIDDPHCSIATLMTPKERLVVVEENNATPQQQQSLLHKHRIERLLVVNNVKDFKLRGMITVKDIKQAENFPSACRDNRGRLRVGAAVGTVDERYAELIEAGVDVLVVDTAHGHSKGVIEQVKRIKQFSSDTQVFAGNIVTADAALALANVGVDAVKVGIGPGSICTTRIVAGVGYPQISAIMQVAQALKGTDVGIIADGGIRFFWRHW